MIFLIKSLFFFLSLLLNIAFFTLWERKILRYMQNRKGPNLVGILGLLQPFSDGIKLFFKNRRMPSSREKIFFKISPFIFFFLRIFIWMGLFQWNLSVENNFLCLIAIRRGGAIVIFLSGWGRRRKFSLMGGVRASAQIISYEVIFSFIFLCFLGRIYNYNIRIYMGEIIWRRNSFISSPLIPIMVLIVLSETNRTPFDLTEGESELVSGFNTEFSAIDFTFLFLGEYRFICLFRIIIRMILMTNWKIFIIFQFFFIWSRASFPRKRYDSLILLVWIWLFPLVSSWLLITRMLLFF